MKPVLPNIRHLRAAQIVAEYNSISKASAKVYLSQPAITQAINKLEAQMDACLFERQPTGMYLTEEGKVFMHRVDRCLNILSEGTKEVYRVGASRETPTPAHIMQLLTTTQLRALIAVCEARNFSLAGRQLGISQSSIHRAARELENLLQITLFEKNKLGISPTRPALTMATAAKLCFSEIKQAGEELESLHNEESGTIVIGSMPLARAHLLPVVINHFSETYPRVQINVVDGPYGDLLNHLRQGDIDILVGALRFPPPSDDVNQQELYRPPLAIFARADHPLHRSARPLTLQALQSHSWVLPRPATPMRLEFDKLFTDQNLTPPQRRVETSSQVLVRELLLGSDRLAIMSIDQFPREEALNLLKPLNFDLNTTQRPIGITRRDSWHPTRGQQLFIDLLMAETEHKQSAKALA